MILNYGKLWTAVTLKIITSGRWINDRWKREIFLFKTLFDLSRYDFRLLRYRRVKGKVIFNRLPSPSLSLTRTSRSHFCPLTYPKLQTSGRRDSWKNVVRISKKKYRSVGHGPIHNLRILLCIMETLNRYISATDWDIRIRQKGISMARFPLFSERVLTTYFPCIGWIF